MKIKQHLSIVWGSFLCAIGRHDYIRTNWTRIDDFGNGDGIKIVICYRCEKPWPKDWNMEKWHECIDIPGTKAYNIIKNIGIENYMKQRKKEGDEIWKNFDSLTYLEGDNVFARYSKQQQKEGVGNARG